MRIPAVKRVVNVLVIEYERGRELRLHVRPEMIDRVVDAVNKVIEVAKLLEEKYDYVSLSVLTEPEEGPREAIVDPVLDL